MIRARKKSIALITALIFMLTIVAPMAAFAGNDDWTEFSSTTKYISTGDEKKAGFISVTGKDFSSNATVKGSVYVVVRVDLPNGVEFNDTDNVRTGLETIKASADWDTYSVGDDYVEVTFDRKTGNDDWWDAKEFKFSFTDNPIDVESDLAGDLKVRVTVDGILGDITFTDWEDLTIAKISSADINVTAASAKTVPMGSGKDLAKITIKEGQADVFNTAVDPKDADWIRFAIMTKGVKFDGEPSKLTNTRLDSQLLKENEGKALNKDADSFKIYITKESVGLPGEITFVPFVKVDPTVTGDIKIRVSSNNKDLSSTTLTVGTVGDVTGEIEKVKDNDTVVYAGSQGTELDVSFEIKAIGDTSFDEGKLISLTLNNGKFVKENLPKFTPTGGDINTAELYNSDKSVYLSTKDGNVTKIKVENIWVKCNNDVEVGDIVLTASGNAGVEGEVVIGEYAKPFTLTAETPNILSEALNQKAGDIVITEVDAEALAPFETVKGKKVAKTAVLFELPSGVELKGTPKVEVDEGNIDVEDPVVIDKNIIALEITSESSDASTIRIHNIKYDTGRLALYGPVELEAYMAYKEEADDKDWKSVDGVMATVANAKVDDQNTVTATFTLGDEGVTIVNGRTLVQVNLLCDVLGLQKSWDAASKTAYFAKDGKVVAFPMGENAVYINGVKLPVDQGGQIINDFTYATLRGLELAFGGDLDWDNDTKTATFVFNK